jgi:hypothetical protein
MVSGENIFPPKPGIMVVIVVMIVVGVVPGR